MSSTVANLKPTACAFLTFDGEVPPFAGMMVAVLLPKVQVNFCCLCISMIPDQ